MNLVTEWPVQHEDWAAVSTVDSMRTPEAILISSTVESHQADSVRVKGSED